MGELDRPGNSEIFDLAETETGEGGDGYVGGLECSLEDGDGVILGGDIV